MPVDRDTIRAQLLRGLGADQIAHGDRAVHHAALEKQARLEGELRTIDPTPENVVRLRDERKLRWEAVAARILGRVAKIAEVKALYEQVKGEGAASRSYTGRGRRFAAMTDEPPTPHEPLPTPHEPLPTREGFETAFGVARDAPASAERLADLEVLRTGDSEEIYRYLDHHLHSDRFYVEGNRIFLELPNRVDTAADRAVLVWYAIPRSYTVAAPTAGSRAGRHAVPEGWTTTLCTLPLSSWDSGARTYSDTDVTCRWCDIRLVAARIVTGETLLARRDESRGRRPAR